MKRSPFKLALMVLAYLAAGAVVNVLVAAGCALWMPLHQDLVWTFVQPPWYVRDWPPQEWMNNQARAAEPPREHWFTFRVSEARGVGVSLVELSGSFTGRGTTLQLPNRVLVIRAGFPWRVMEAASAEEPCHWFSQKLPTSVFSPVATLPLSPQPMQQQLELPRLDLRTVTRNFIPLAPVWAALIANTIVWAFILALLVRGPRWVRGEIRMRRGLCRSCGYPVGVADRCTECGHVLPARADVHRSRAVT